MIGSFGNRSFHVSSRNVSTFDNFNQSVAINVENTEVDGNKPTTNIKGRKLGDIGFSVALKDRWVNVRTEVESWQKLCEDGVPQVLIIGGKPVGSNKWLLTAVELKDTVIDNNGQMQRAVLDLTLQEFVRSGKAAQASGAKSSGKAVTKNPKGTVPDTPAVADSERPRSVEDKKRINGNVAASIGKGPKTVARKPGTLYVLKKDA